MTSTAATPPRAGRIAVVLPSLEGGGAERSMLTLVKGFLGHGRQVDLVLCKAKGAYLNDIPTGANMIELQPTSGVTSRWLAALGNPANFSTLLKPVLLASKIAPEIARMRALQHYIERRRPDIILSALTYANLVAIWANYKTGSPVPVVVSERIALSTYCSAPSNARKWRWRYLPALVRQSYPLADAVVAVSGHVADDLVSVIGLPRDLVTAIHNPVVDDALRHCAQQAPHHKWFAQDAVPVILAGGRLTEQKGFATLLHAFARVRAQRPAHLVILGEGKQRQALQRIALELGIGADVDMPGFATNPFQYMARASVFVLSSEYEGLPGVLIQALACGCPIVSTDCPGGSREILADGRFGALVPVGDADKMAQAVLAQLDNPPPRDILLRRAEDFSVEHGVNSYLALLDTVVTHTAQRH